MTRTMDSLIPLLAIYALPIIFAITLHEAAHGYVARYFGDPTAYLAGRISLNPIRHIDLMGTIIVPMLTLAVGKFSGAGIILFGWAKPVPVDFGRLRNPKRDMLWVAAAGPAANLAMALMWASALKFVAILPGTGYSEAMISMAMAGIQINAVLMLLNLFPIPPLDGGRIAISLLPHRLAWHFARLEPYGMILLLILLFTGMLNQLLWPLLVGFRYLLSLIFNF